MKKAKATSVLIVIVVVSLIVVGWRSWKNDKPIRTDGDRCAFCGEMFICLFSGHVDSMNHNRCPCGNCKASYRVNLDWKYLKRDGDWVYDSNAEQWFIPWERQETFWKRMRCWSNETFGEAPSGEA